MAEYAHESTGDSTGFSWSACDRCGSDLGGDRHEWSYRDENDDICTGEVCTDCLFEINGLEVEGRS